MKPVRALPPSNSTRVKKITTNLSFDRSEEEKSVMKEKYKKIMQSDEFTAEPEVDLEACFSPIKGSTSFKITHDTPAKIQCDFKIGGGDK